MCYKKIFISRNVLCNLKDYPFYLGGIEAGLRGTIWIPTVDKSRLLREDPQPDFTVRHVTDVLTILNRGPDAPELEDSSSNASDGS